MNVALVLRRESGKESPYRSAGLGVLDRLVTDRRAAHQSEHGAARGHDQQPDLRVGRQVRAHGLLAVGIYRG